MKKFFAVILVVMVMLASSAAFASDKDMPRWAPKYNSDTFVVEIDENVMWYCLSTQVKLDLLEMLGYYPVIEEFPEDGLVEIKLLNITVQVQGCIVDDKNPSLILIPDFCLPREVEEKNNLNLLFPSGEEDEENFINVKALELNGAKLREVFNHDDKTVSITVMSNGEYRYLSTPSFYEEDGEYFVSCQAFKQLWYDCFKK